MDGFPEYVPYYCEENIWRLLRRPRFVGRDVHALFIFGASGRVAVFGQRAGDPQYGGLALWDYHVVCLDRERKTVLDYDSAEGAACGFEIPAGRYFDAAFGPLRRADPEAAGYFPLFRVVPRDEFIERFDSDRSHMLIGVGSYSAPPPPWPHPRCPESARALRLSGLIDPAASFPGLPFGGRALSLDEARSFALAPGLGSAI